MSDREADESLADVRERKKEELKRRAESGGDGTDGSGAVDTPDEPVRVDSTEQYEGLVDEHDVVLVDFYADWCGPCQAMEPVVAELAKDTEAAVLKVDVDEHEGLAHEMGVQGVPTMVVYADGEVDDRVVGAQQREDLAAMIASAG